MTTQTLTAEYVAGISEGRKFWRTMSPTERAIDAPAILANIEDTMREFGAGPVKDMLRGERDFWRNQIRLHG